MIRTLTLQSFKALANVRVPLDPLTVLVGQNASGKSTVLEGAQYLALLGVEQPDEANFAALRCGALFRKDREVGRLLTLGSKPGTTMSLRCDFESPRFLSVAATPSTGSFELAFDLAGRAEELQIPVRAEQNPWAFFSHISANGIGEAAFLRLDPRSLARASYIKGERPELASNGRGLASVLAYHSALRDGVVERIESDLAQVVPVTRRIRTLPAEVRQVEDLQLTVDGELVEHSVSRAYTGHRLEVELATGGGTWCPADMLSEGTLLALGLLTVLHDQLDLALLLLDDIEHGLHPAAQGNLVTCLRRLQAERPGLQILCTSHSPYVLDHFESNEVRVMALDPSGLAHCRPLLDHPNAKNLQHALKTGELWSTFGEEWVGAANGA